MSWPVSQDYNEAIQDPPSAFKDPELRGGELTLNALGLPLPRSGNFADVYEMACPATQTKWAVKCFTREVPGLQQRYSAISRHLSQAGLPFTVDFQFLDKGIRVRGQWYPILKMRWVEGLLLNEFVRDALDKPALLQALQQIWGRLAKRLREADIAHADLQHGNVLLVPGSKAAALAVKLIDYDGMWVPALAQTKSGEVGHPNYQHPQRLREGTYTLDVDRFPFLVTATALRALAVAGRTLWERYDNGDNLLFKETDLRSPEESQLFHELSTVADPTLQALLVPLRQACRGRLQETPLLDEVAPEEKSVAVQTAPPPVPTTGALPADDWGTISKPEAAARGQGKIIGTKKALKRGKKSGVPTWAWVAGGGGFASLVAVVLILVLMGNLKPTVVAGNLGFTNPVHPLIRPSTPTTNVTPTPPATSIAPPATTKLPATRIAPPPSTATSKPPPAAWQKGIFRMYDVAAAKVVISHPNRKDWLVMDTTSPADAQRFSGHTAPITCFSMTADGKFAITGSVDRTVRVWDVAEGKSIGELRGFEKPVISATVSPDGTRAWTVEGTNVVGLWDVAKGARVPPQRAHVGAVFTYIACARDGKFLDLGLFTEGAERPGLYIWEAVGNAANNGPTPLLPGPIWCTGHPADGIGTALAIGGNKLWIHDGATKLGVIYDAPNVGVVTSMTYSADGKKLLVCSESGFYVWDVPAGKAPGPVRVVEKGALTAGFTGDGKTLLCVELQPDGKTLRRFEIDLPSDKPVVKAPPPKDTPDPRLRVPSADAYAAAETDLHEKFKDLYQKSSPLLPGKLWNHAFGRGEQNADSRYVAFRELRDQAVKKGDVFEALRYAGDIAFRYQVGRLDIKVETLESVARAVHDPKAGQRVVDQALKVVHQARAEDDYEAALRAVKAARDAANKVPNTAQKSHLARFAGEVTREKAEFTQVKQALEVLATAPDDLAANLAMGRFRCCQEVWEEGLFHLSKGSDVALRDLATKDRAEPAKAADRKALAEAWAEQAKKEKDALQIVCWRRAYASYKQAAANLLGLDQAAVKNQMAMLAQKGPDLAEPFHELDLSEGNVRNDMIYLEKGKLLTTRRWYRGGVDITVSFRSLGSAIRLTAGAGGMVTFNSDPDGLVHVYRPDRPAGDSRVRPFGSELGTKDIGKLKGNFPQKVRWQLTLAGQKLWHNDLLIFESMDPCDLSAFYPVGLSTPTDPLLEVKSMTVKSLATEAAAKGAAGE